MNARDDYPLDPYFVSRSQHATMCAEINRLRAENAEAVETIGALETEIGRLRTKLNAPKETRL